MKKLVSLLLAGTMLLSTTPLGAGASAAAKWTSETTEDGWVRVVNDGGATLGYTEASGIQLIEDDGYAFKDLNRNGELDPYEDWRLDAETRAADLAGQMTADKILNMMLHPSLGGIETDGSSATMSNNPFTDYLDRGLRYALNGSVGNFPQKALATFNNNTQAYVEGLDWGIPVSFSSNPNNLGYARSLSLASTFDPEYVMGVYAEEAELYRAIGVTTLLGPQMDLTTEPRWNRIRDTYGEDPALSADMADAAVSGLQSTWAEDGTDLGWGEDSVATMMKHWPGDGSGESGRESHSASGKYTVYPNGNFDTILIPFVDGALNLTSITGQATGTMTSYSIAYSDTEEYGELVASPYSEYKVSLMRSYNPDALICTDWGSLTNKAYGIDANATEAEKLYMIISAGVDQIGGVSDTDLDGAWALLVEDLGEEAALARLQDSAYRLTLPLFEIGLFENAYVSTADTVAAYSDEALADAQLESQLKSIVMLKNSGNTIAPASETTGEKPTVYIPMVWENGVGATPGQNTTPKWHLNVDLAEASHYFNVVTDTVAEPSGTDSDGKPCYTENDIIRASAEEIAQCDMVLCFTEGPKNEGSEGKGYGHDNSTDEYFPISLQFGEYVADSDGVRSESISGDMVARTINDLYADITVVEKANNSYFGQAARIVNSSDLDGILYAAANAKEGAPVIVCINTTRPIIVSEFEDAADAILIGFSIDYESFLPVITGEVEPTGLLPLQMPANMETVEAQSEDTPRDMECYVDADGNTYDFAFGMNWSGVIQDERVEKYSVEPLTTPVNQPEQ